MKKSGEIFMHNNCNTSHFPSPSNFHIHSEYKLIVKAEMNESPGSRDKGGAGGIDSMSDYVKLNAPLTLSLKKEHSLNLTFLNISKILTFLPPHENDPSLWVFSKFTPLPLPLEFNLP